jgi:hypothetical protein
MPYTIHYLQDEGIVLITNNGELTYEDFVKQAQETLEIGRINKCRLFLADCTSMISRVGTMEIFDTPAVYNNLEAPRTNKVALIISEDKDTNEDIGFYETVCVNRGWPVRVFNDKKAAMKWLRK